MRRGADVPLATTTGGSLLPETLEHRAALNNCRFGSVTILIEDRDDAAIAECRQW